MFQISTSLKKLSTANALYERGIDGQITFEKGKLAMKAFATTKPEVEAHDQTNKFKAEAYNKKLEEVKNKAKADGLWDGKDVNTVNVPFELVQERKQLFEDVETSMDEKKDFQFGDDNYRAMLDVCQNAQKSWYKAIQDKNECTDNEKREKITAPSLVQFNDFNDFIEDLNNAEKVKEGQKE